MSEFVQVLKGSTFHWFLVLGCVSVSVKHVMAAFRSSRHGPRWIEAGTALFWLVGAQVWVPVWVFSDVRAYVTLALLAMIGVPVLLIDRRRRAPATERQK